MDIVECREVFKERGTDGVVNLLYNSIRRTPKGWALPVDMVVCLDVVKQVLISLAMETASALDIQYANFVVMCDAFNCYISDAFHEILTYAFRRFGGAE